MKYQLIPQQTLIGTVKAVHDGDSFKIEFPEETSWIRLWGCDSPEVISNHVTQHQPYGKEAGNEVRNLIKGQKVEVQTLFKDQFGRMICKVKIPINEVMTDLTEILIRNGLAWFLQEPNMTEDEVSNLKRWHEKAKNSKVGLWGTKERKLRPSTWRNRYRRFSLTKEFPDLW